MVVLLLKKRSNVDMRSGFADLEGLHGASGICHTLPFKT